MIELIQSLILESQTAEPVAGTPRRIRIESLPGKVTALIGVRRCGKTTCMRQHMARLRAEGVPSANLFYLDFSDDRLHELSLEHLDLIPQAYFGRYPEKKGREKIYLFFDEIQFVAGWERFVERLRRTENCEIWLAGSSAKLLSREIATEMRGRSLAWEVFPFSFREFLDSRGIDAAGDAWPPDRQAEIRHAFDAYWKTGGFPEALGCSPALRVRLHQEYFHAVLHRDLIERYGDPRPTAVRDLARRLIDNAAAMHTVNRLTGYLKSLGHRVPKTAVAGYLERFEDAYALFSVRLFDASAARANVNPKKIYCIDHAFARSVGSGILVNSGHLLENLVFCALRRRATDVRYYRTERRREIDFVVRSPDGSWMLVQVCETLADPGTRAREVGALAEAMAELRLREGFLVTRQEQEEIDVGAGTVRVLPVWRFLLLADGEAGPPGQKAGRS